MNKQAMELAISALEMYCEHGAILRPIETLNTIRQALKNHGEEAAKMVNAEPITWICPRCKVDRIREDCKGNRMSCPMHAFASAPKPE